MQTMITDGDSASLFAERIGDWGERCALVTEDGVRVTYAELEARCVASQAHLPARRQVVALEASNDVETITAYLCALRAHCPVILLEPGAMGRDARIANTFRPHALWHDGRWSALSDPSTIAPHPDLCILLSTSGTTGSPKLVRLSQRNIESNARSIAQYLGLGPDERAITTLPFHYSFGMSVVNSHLAAGAALLLTARSVTQEEFWAFFDREGGTSLSAVPYTFELLDRTGFRDSHHPTLRYLAQAGGKLPADRVMAYAQWAQDKGTRFYVMYGQTEAAPRMAYVPPESILDHPGTIGIPIPGGAIRLINSDGNPVEAVDSPGELVYTGPNVMLGYGIEPADLAKGREVNELRTGDLACRNADGLFYIIGRMNRFSKMFGLRIALDEVENELRKRGHQSLVAGNDACVAIAVLLPADCEQVTRFVSEHYGLPRGAIHAYEVAALPTLSSGKFDYRSVLSQAEARAVAPTARSYASLIELYTDVMELADVRAGDSFHSLGGDSLHYVALSLAIEDYLGVLPENWEALPISTLEGFARRAASVAPAQAPRRGVGWIVIAACLLFVIGELLLQVRSHLRTGRSVFRFAAGESTMVTNAETGLLTFRPNLRLKARQKGGVSLAINSLGLRSDEIPQKPAPGELRIAVLGASTVAGAYTPTNEETFSGRLQSLLRERFPNRPVNVINAGIHGMGLDDMRRMLTLVVAKLSPGMVIIYPGFNDMGTLCAGARRDPTVMGLPTPKLPSWVLSNSLVSLNTVTLRQHPGVGRVVTEADFADYTRQLNELVQAVKDRHMQPVLVTVARAFFGAPRQEQERLAQTALFFNPCLDLDGVLASGEVMNDTIRKMGVRHGVPVVDLAVGLPGGKRYFVDTSHFNVAGDRMVSELLRDALFTIPETRAWLEKPAQ